MRTLILILGLLLTVASHAQVVIDSDTDVPYSDRFLRRTAVWWSPGTNETVEMNPPRFSWPWDFNYSYGLNSYHYQLQIGYDTNFNATAVVNRTTEINFLNEFDAFTEGLVYWRVGYISQTNPILVTNWTAARSFTITNGTRVWNRGGYTNLSSRYTHPRLYIEQTNLAAVKTLVKSADWYWVYESASNQVYHASYGFTNTPYWTYSMADLATNTIDRAKSKTVSLGLSYVSYLWLIDSNAAQLDVDHACLMLENTVTNYTTTHNIGGTDYDWWMFDPWGDDQCNYMGIAYDYLYGRLTSTQRNNIIASFDKMAIGQITNSIIYSGRFIGKSTPMAGAVMAAHSVGGIIRPMSMSIPVLEDSTNSMRYFNLALNYLTSQGWSRGDSDGMDWGTYIQVHLGSQGYGRTANNHLMATFLGSDYTNNPATADIAYWFTWIAPVGWRTNGDDPHGDGGGGYPGQSRVGLAGQDGAVWLSFEGQLMARLSRDPRVQKQILDAMPYEGNRGTPDPWTVASLVNFPTNSAAEMATLTDTNHWLVKPYGGWVMAANLAPIYSISDWSNRVALKARITPWGSDGNHIFASDGHTELMAFGAQILPGGAGYAGNGGSAALQSGFSRNLPMHGGIPISYSQSGPNDQYPKREWYSKVVNWDVSTNYFYWQGDITSNYMDSATLTKAKVHGLFMREKYLVVAWDLGASTNSYFQLPFWENEGRVTNASIAGWTFGTSNLFTIDPQVTTRVVQVATNGMGLFVNQRGVNFTNTSDQNKIYNKVFTNYFVDPAAGYHNFNSTWSHFFRANCLYMTNEVAATNVVFIQVIYPEKPGESSPTITRLDDRTVSVTDAQGTNDVISFVASTATSTNAQATLLVMMDGGSDAPAPGPGESSPTGPSTFMRGPIVIRGGVRIR